jgi:hypothetical protein
MKRRNGFFSFSIVTVAVLTLSLALTAATLAWQHFQMARTYEETVRLTYLAESALCEGWNQLRQDPDAFLAGQAMAVPRAEGLAGWPWGHPDRPLPVSAGRSDAGRLSAGPGRCAGNGRPADVRPALCRDGR